MPNNKECESWARVEGCKSLPVTWELEHSHNDPTSRGNRDTPKIQERQPGLRVRNYVLVSRSLSCGDLWNILVSPVYCGENLYSVVDGLNCGQFPKSKIWPESIRFQVSDHVGSFFTHHIPRCHRCTSADTCILPEWRFTSHAIHHQHNSSMPYLFKKYLEF